MQHSVRMTSIECTLDSSFLLFLFYYLGFSFFPIFIQSSILSFLLHILLVHWPQTLLYFSLYHLCTQCKSLNIVFVHHNVASFVGRYLMIFSIIIILFSGIQRANLIRRRDVYSSSFSHVKLLPFPPPSPPLPPPPSPPLPSPFPSPLFNHLPCPYYVENYNLIKVQSIVSIKE